MTDNTKPGHNNKPPPEESTDRQHGWGCEFCSHWKAPSEREQKAYEKFRLGLSRRRVKRPTGTCNQMLRGDRTYFSATPADFGCGNFKPAPPKPIARGGSFVTVWENGRIVWQGDEQSIPAHFRHQGVDLQSGENLFSILDAANPAAEK